MELWISILDATTEQYIFCKQKVDSLFVPALCLKIENGYFWLVIQNEVKNTTLPVLTGWNMISIYFSGNDTVNTNSINVIQMMYFNDQLRAVSPLLYMRDFFNDDITHYTLFGTRQYGVNIFSNFFVGFIYDIALSTSPVLGDPWPRSDIESYFVSCKFK